MKTKKIKKRLALNKISIAHLHKYKIDNGKVGLPLKAGVLEESPSKPCKTYYEPACFISVVECIITVFL